MTTVKIVVSLLGVLSGTATSITAGIASSIPQLSNDTPIGLTFGLILGGLVFTAVSAWNVATAWSKMQAKVQSLEDRVKKLESDSSTL